jgi:thioredoxin-related protein
MAELKCMLMLLIFLWVIEDGRMQNEKIEKKCKEERIRVKILFTLLVLSINECRVCNKPKV